MHTTTTGITVFELQGNFGKLYWLGNFYIVFCFNAIFAVVTGLCLVKKFTNNLREALVKALSKYTINFVFFFYDLFSLLHLFIFCALWCLLFIAIYAYIDFSSFILFCLLGGRGGVISKLSH